MADDEITSSQIINTSFFIGLGVANTSHKTSAATAAVDNIRYWLLRDCVAELTPNWPISHFRVVIPFYFQFSSTSAALSDQRCWSGLWSYREY